MSVRATRVGVKIKPPTLIVIYTLDTDSLQNRIRKIPIRGIEDLTVEDVVTKLLKRPNHANLLRTINGEKLRHIISKLPGLKADLPALDSESEANDSIHYSGSNLEDTTEKSIKSDISRNDQRSHSTTRSTEKSNAPNEILDFLKTTTVPSRKIDAKEKTNFDFLDTDEDDDSFKPLDLTETIPAPEQTSVPKPTNLDFLDSDNISINSNDVIDKKLTKDKTTIPKNTNLDFLDSDSKSSDSPPDFLKSSDQVSKNEDNTEGYTIASEVDSTDESEVTNEESENPFLKNLKASAEANQSDSDDSITSDISQTSEDISNLNQLSDNELNKHKLKMDINFKANQLKPDDPDFVYDKQVEFNPQENCEWDDSIIE